MTPLLVILPLLALAHVSGAEDERGKEIFKECMETHSIQEEKIKEYFEDKKLPETENGKCFLECMMVKTEVYKDGKFDEERAKAENARKFKEKPELWEKADKIVVNCASEVAVPEGSPKCEYAVEYTKCVFKYCDEMGIKPSDLH